MLKIGLLCERSEESLAHEFFQLFKTPWEFFRKDQDYSVVISTMAGTPTIENCLLIQYCSASALPDKDVQITVEEIQQTGLLLSNGDPLPLYGKLARLQGPGVSLLHCASGLDKAALQIERPNGSFIRVGYDLFFEISYLLLKGQPENYATTATLEKHIEILRNWIIGSDIPLIEIPPVPWGFKLIACLTHDVDFVGIRRHKFDHTMWGFIYRALVRSPMKCLRGEIKIEDLFKNWMAVFSLPLVYLGICPDFWHQFDRYMDLEKDLGSTFFMIPCRDTIGESVQGARIQRRAAKYELSELKPVVNQLIPAGFEIGLHGIDAWHSLEKAKQEMRRITEITNNFSLGVRMHWLCFESSSFKVLDEAGFNYDATFGYNNAIGFKAGTAQVFRPPGAKHLVELPLIMQDVALFQSDRLGLNETQAWDQCIKLIESAARFGGALTILWHLRSLAPERHWGRFYCRIIDELRERGAWFGTANQVVSWFRKRRAIVFDDAQLQDSKIVVRLKHGNPLTGPDLRLQIHRPSKRAVHCISDGKSPLEFKLSNHTLFEIPID